MARRVRRHVSRESFGLVSAEVRRASQGRAWILGALLALAVPAIGALVYAARIPARDEFERRQAETELRLRSLEAVVYEIRGDLKVIRAEVSK